MGTTLLRGKRIRLTRLDGCGNPVLGPDSVVVVKGIMVLALTPNNDTGTAITVVDANGDQCVNDVPVPKFLNFGANVSFCGVEAAAYELLSSQEAIRDADGNLTGGIAVDSDADMEGKAFALEFWAGVPAALCIPGAAQTWGYGLMPFWKGGTIGAFNVENAAANFSVEGMTTQDNNGWGVGPYDVLVDPDTGEAGPLPSVLPVKRHLYLNPTSVPPPDVTDGFAALGVPATGATAGTPGTWTPGNSYAPLNLDELQDGAAGEHGVNVVASPATAWTTGQRVVLRDGSVAHWTSSAWAAGAA